MIKGDVVDIIYRNEENGFSIIVMDIEGDPVVCKGTFPSVVEGQTLALEGKFVVHPKYGKQYDVQTVEVCQPEGVDGIVRYLGSGIIKGIGPRLALRIASYFGDKTFEVIEYTPHLLAKVSGISKKKGARNFRSVYEHKGYARRDNVLAKVRNNAQYVAQNL